MELKPQNMVGVEFGTSAVYIVKTGRNGRAERVGYAKMPDGMRIFPGHGEEYDQTALDLEVLGTLRRAAKDAGIKGGRCAVCVSGPEIILRRFTMPNMEQDALKLNVIHEIQSYIALSPENYYIDSKVHSFEVGRDGAVQLNVLVAAAERRRVDRLKHLLRDAGFNPIFVDVAENAREKLFNFLTGGSDLTGFDPKTATQPGRPGAAGDRAEVLKTGPGSVNAAIIAFGDYVTSVSILLGRRFYVSRYFNTGSILLDETIAAASGIDSDKAEALRHDGDFFNSDSPSAQQVRTVIDAMVSEIASVIDYCFYRERHNKVDCVYITGTLSDMHGLVPYLDEAFGIRVCRMDDIIAERLIPKQLSAGRDISMFAGSLGATFREVSK